jgi:hypothetical protein
VSGGYPRRLSEKDEAYIAEVVRCLDFDVVTHEHSIGRPTHRHAWGVEPHSHLLRAICGREECKGDATHDIHHHAEPAEISAPDI